MGEGQPGFREEVVAESSEIGETTSDKNRATLLARHLAEKFDVSVKDYRENSGDSSSFELTTNASNTEIAEEIMAFFEPLGFEVRSAKETPGMFLIKKDADLVLSVTVGRGDKVGRTIIGVRELVDTRRNRDNPKTNYYGGFTMKDIGKY